MTIAIILLVIVVVLLVALVALYNNLVKLRNMVDNAWAQVDVQLQRRLDLIPHESQTLEEVTHARAAVSNATTPESRMGANSRLNSALKSLFAVAESYPELKANQNFQQLQAELSETEDKISYMRQSFNDTVMKYNTAIQTFPAVLIAGAMGFKERPSFAADAPAHSVPQVTF